MITVLLLILIIFIPSFYVSIRKNFDIEKVIPCTIFSLILIIYLFGLINLLKLGVFTVYTLSIIFIFKLLLDVIKHKINIKENIKIVLKPSMIIWFVGIFLLYFYYRGRLLISWDEFSHWGDVVKMMYYNNIYNTNPASLSAARGYPPIMSIFQYFVENLSINGFKEHYLFLAYHVFIISLIISFLKKLKWKDIIKIILILLIIVIAPTVFFSSPYYYYNIIYIDPFLGILFGYLMANIYLLKKYGKFEIVNISLALFALTLTKDIAPVFSFITLIYIFFDIVIVQKKYKLISEKSKKNLKKFFGELKPVLIFFMVIIISYLSWKLNVILNTKDIVSDNSSSIIDMIKQLFKISGTYKADVVSNYINALSNYKLTSMGNIYIFSSIMILFSILLYNNEKDSDKDKSLFGFINIYLGEILYVVLMLILYIIIFTEYEALRLASFDRYMGIYLIAILYFIIFITIYRGIETKKYQNLLIVLLIIVLNTNMSTVLINTLNYKNNKNYIQEKRKPYIEAASSIHNKINTNKKYKFYIIVQNSEGYEKWVLRYEIRDILKKINEGFNWSLGEKYGDNDIWTLDISKDEFINILIDENYDYLFLYRIDEKFIDRYENLFDSENIESGQLYKVNKEKRVLEFVN